MVAHYNRTDEICRIDAITFSPKSAELVVAVTIFDGKVLQTLSQRLHRLIFFLIKDDETTYEILVLASFDRVVDLLSIHEGCVKCLLWNADGSMLGMDNQNVKSLVVTQKFSF